MYRTMDGPTVTTLPLPGGDEGTRKTIGAMRELAVRGSRSLEVRDAVIRALRMNAAPHDIRAQVNTWFEWVKTSIYFLHDPRGTEWVQSPRYTLKAGAGDCDDRAVLLAAGLMSFGVPAHFKVAALDRRRPREMSHVYVVATVHGRPVSLDPTYEENRMGDDPARDTSRTWMVPVWPTSP